MVTITFPTDTVTIIDAIREVIGREVDFITSTETACTVCSLDPVTNTSTNSFCPLCSGLYWIPTYSGEKVQAHVTWSQADIMNWYSTGQQFDGDCRVQIKYTVANLDLVDNSDWLECDGKKLQIKKRILRGVPVPNRLLLDCIELEKEA